MAEILFKKFKEIITHHETAIIFIIVLASIIEYFFNVELAHLLSPEDYGDISVALTVALFWSVVAELGATKAIQKYLPNYYELGKIDLAKGLLIFYLIISVGVAVLVAGFITLITYLDFIYLHMFTGNQPGTISAWLHLIKTDQHAALMDISSLHKIATQQYHPVLLALWIVPVIVVSSILSAVLKSLNHYVLSILPNFVLLYFLAMPIFWACYQLGFPVTDWNLLALYGLAYLFICILQAGITYHYLPRNMVSIKAHYKMPQWIKLSIPLMLSTLFFIAIKQVNLIMVELLETDQNTIGYFAAAQKVSGFILVFFAGMNVIYVPMASRVLLQGNSAIKNFIIMSTRKIFYVCFPMLLLIIIFAEFLLDLFGSEYRVAYWPVLILAVGNFLNVLVGYHVILLQYAYQHYKILFIQFISLIINILLSWLLIPLWGITGAAIAASTTLIGMGIVITILSMKKFTVHLTEVL